MSKVPYYRRLLYQVMKKEKYELQKKTRSQNEYRIFTALRVGERRFTELLKFTGLSPAGLDKLLKNMQRGGKIIRKEVAGKISYRQDEGTTVKEMLYLGHTIEELMDNDAKYYIDYSDNIQSEVTEYSLSPYGILSHLFLDKEIGKDSNPFSKKDIFTLEMNVFEKIRSNVDDMKVILNRNIIDKKDKKLVLAFEIDYGILSKSIKSLSEKDHKKLLKTRLKELE